MSKPAQDKVTISATELADLRRRVTELETERLALGHAEEALRASEQKYRTLVETTDTGYVIVDTAGRVVDANPEYVRLTGHSTLQEILGRSVIEWTAPHDLERNAAELRHCAERGFVRHFEIDYINPRVPGGLAPIEVNATVFHSETGMVFVALCRDISERRRAAQMQQRMLSEMDHRVRNNLASLAALIDISRGNKSTVAEFAASIRGRVQAMSTVHGILSRSRWHAVDLQTLIQTLMPADLLHRVRINGPVALINPRQATAFGMVLQELIANSLKYGSLSQPGGNIDTAWSIKNTAEPTERKLFFTWKEIGGPRPASTPAASQGTELILGFARIELRGSVELTYPPQGAQHKFVSILDPVKESN